MKQSLPSLITSHRKQHPSARARDIYKMLHQGTMGPRHLLENENAARALLLREYEHLEARAQDEPLTEQVSTDGSIVRINLRPFKKLPGNLNALFECVILSAKHILPDECTLFTLWEGFKTLNRQDVVRFDHHEIASLDEKFSHEGFIPISHSEEYRMQEKPSYRVVLLNRTAEICDLSLNNCI